MSSTVRRVYGAAAGGPGTTLRSEMDSAELAATTVLDLEGHTVRLGTLWERRPAVIAWLRHYG